MTRMFPTKYISMNSGGYQKIRLSLAEIISLICCPLPPCWLVWDKDNTGNFADCELCWTSFPTAVRKYKWRWNGLLQEDMAHKIKRVHPTEKPYPLLEEIIRDYSKEGDIIFDGFAGSFSVAHACINTWSEIHFCC